MTYAQALSEGRRLGSGACGDGAAMALFCDVPLQQLVGAVSPQLVWEGARKTGLKLVDLGRLCSDDPMAVADLMWL